MMLTPKISRSRRRKLNCFVLQTTARFFGTFSHRSCIRVCVCVCTRMANRRSSTSQSVADSGSALAADAVLNNFEATTERPR
ncbi:hypothetical protein C8R44DRAFT_773384 [Mycena epipterygia]|nr:hypothetical protein C8R44DRAFT_773384 [Mycena epipterygia]